MFKLFFCVLSGVVGDDLAGAVQFVFVNDQALEADGAAGVDLVGADELHVLQSV